MNPPRQFLALLAGGIGTAAALLGAPLAAADESGGAGNTTAPECESAGGGGDGESTICESPGSAELSATPNNLGFEGEMIDSFGGAFGGF
jgi:hypothetical protein